MLQFFKPIPPCSKRRRHCTPWLLILAVSLLWTAGCAKEPKFRLNAVYKLTVEKEFLDGDKIPPEQIEQLGNVMTALFGTPSEPTFPAGNESFIDPNHLALAGGPVFREPNGVARGLYRQHCVHCHGITGDGLGPTAPYLNPYPRDFRLGKFKFKSTKVYRPPTDHDLKQTLKRGISGTSMPSFALLEDGQLDALVDYVKFLSIRGLVERALMEDLVNLDEGEQLMASKESIAADAYDIQLELVMERISPIIRKWQRAEKYVIEVPELPENYRFRRGGYASLGKQLFFAEANCVQCHGPTGIGDGQTENYDDWTNDWLKRGNVDLNNPDELRQYREAGVLPPRKIRPRNLRHRVFRGGSQPEDLFRRIRAGIEGSSMPGIPNLSDEEIWSLIAYVLEITYEKVDGRVREKE